MDRRLRLALGAIAALLALWGGGWFVVAKIVESRATDWIERERALGNRLVYRDARRRGFPVRLARGREPVRDRARRRRSRRCCRARGSRRSSRPGISPTCRCASPASTATSVATRPTSPRSSSRRRGPRRACACIPTAASARSTSISATPPHARPAPSTPRPRAPHACDVVAKEIDPVDPNSREFFNVAIALDEMVPPTSWQPPFNRPLKSGEAVIGVRGERVRNPNAAEQLIAWRDSGGVVELYRLQLDWAPLMISGDGTGGLDAQNRPEAALSMRVAGYAELLDALVQSRQIGARQAQMFAALLGGMARNDPATGRREVRIPITAQNGRLTIAGFPLIALPPIQLPTR
jgi:hypothetical protein